MNRIKDAFNIDKITLIKCTAFLISLFVLEFFLWQKLNYYHRSNEIAMGSLIAFLIFLASCISFWLLIHKGYDKWALLVVVHILGLFFIDRITLDNGSKRYLDTKQETWEFYHDEFKYLVKRDKKFEHLIIYQATKEHPNDKSFNPIINGKCLKLTNGWRLSNDSSDIKILDNSLIGFPTEKDTFNLKKIYFNE